MFGLDKISWSTFLLYTEIIFLVCDLIIMEIFKFSNNKRESINEIRKRRSRSESGINEL